MIEIIKILYICGNCEIATPGEIETIVNIDKEEEIHVLCSFCGKLLAIAKEDQNDH